MDKDLFEKPLTSKIFVNILLLILESFCVAVLETYCSESPKQEVKQTG